MQGGSAGPVFQLALLSLALFGSNFARSAVGPAQETMRAALSLTDNAIAMLQGLALALPIAAAALPLGLLVDSLSRKRLLLVFSSLSIAGGIATALAPSFGILFVARCLTGLAAFAIPAVVLSLVADLYPASQRGRASMALAVGEIAGASAAFALGGLALTATGGGPAGYRLAMLVSCVPLALVAAAMFALREPPRGQTAKPHGSARTAFAALLAVRHLLLPLLVAKILVVTAYGAVVTWTAPSLSRSFDLPPGQVGSMIAACLLVGGLLGPLAGGFLADFCQRTGGPRRTMTSLVWLALLSAPAGLFALAPSPLSLAILLLLFVTLISVIGVVEMTLATIVLPENIRGLCLSALIASGLIVGIGAAPLSVSLLSGALGGSTMIEEGLAIVCAGTGLLAAAIFAVGVRFMPSKTQIFDGGAHE